MTEEKIFNNLRITDADLLERIDQYMKDHPDSVIPVDEAQIARITELVKDVKLDEEIPHREQQIQWHEDMLHHLRTGEPMREWQFRHVLSDGAVSEWSRIDWPGWRNKDIEYRRKPRTIRYWHCATEHEGMYGLIRSFEGVDSLQKIVDQNKSRNPTTKFSQIIETTVEMED